MGFNMGHQWSLPTAHASTCISLSALPLLPPSPYRTYLHYTHPPLITSILSPITFPLFYNPPLAILYTVLLPVSPLPSSISPIYTVILPFLITPLSSYIPSPCIPPPFLYIPYIYGNSPFPYNPSILLYTLSLYPPPFLYTPYIYTVILPFLITPLSSYIPSPCIPRPFLYIPYIYGNSPFPYNPPILLYTLSLYPPSLPLYPLYIR